MQGVETTEFEEVRRYLASTDLFRGLDPNTLSSIEAELEWVTLNAGDVLVRAGDVGDCMFILLSGRLRVFIARENAEESPVAEISPGEAVGEMALILEERRSATVKAVRSSSLVRLTRAVFENLETRHPDLMKHMAQLLVRRLRRVNSSGARRDVPLTVGFISPHPDFPLSSVVERFVEALSAIGATRHLNAAIIEAQAGAGWSQASGDDPLSVNLTHWLAEQERAHRFVVYEADEPDSAWTRTVVQHSDRIMIAVPASEQPTAQIREVLKSSGVWQSSAHKDLVLVHTWTDRKASGTRLWMDEVQANERIHLWLYSSEDFDRLARFVSGNAVGLVLGGGGARGFAHIGVVRALREARIPIDYVGGVSIGALIAAEVALEWTSAQMLETTREAFKNHPLHGDYTMPVISAMTPHKAVRLFEQLFGEALIEDNWRNFFSVACNLTRGEMVVQREGRFHDAAEASSALPLLNAPVIDNGDVIVDGALINNLPADVMKSLCGGRVVAVDVSPRRHLHAEAGERDLRSNSRIVRAAQRASTGMNTYGIVMRTVMLNTVVAADSMKRHIDWYLKPPVEKIEMFDWSAIDEAVEMGYQYAIDQLETRPDF